MEMQFYFQEAINQKWKVRELKRQRPESCRLTQRPLRRQPRLRPLPRHQRGYEEGTCRFVGVNTTPPRVG